MTLILASASPARAALLRQAGVPFVAHPSRVDEAAVKAALLAEGAGPRDIADHLAELKALRLATRHPDALILGSDQVLALGDQLFDKPADIGEARAQLRDLAGRTHLLLSAAVIVEGGRPVWRHVGQARLTMRSFSDDFLDDHLHRLGNGILTTVGAYKIEDGGTQLFDRIEGDYFSILGLPLLPVLAFLRTRGVIAE
jgi:septum formation protein